MNKPQNAQEFIAQQRQAIASNPDCGTSHYNLAVALMGVQEFAEAEKELMAAIECSPGLAEGYVQLGALCLRRGDLEGCLKWNQQAVKARPGFSEGHGNIGFVHLQMGNVDEAIVSLKRATHFNFRYVQAFASLATAHLMKGEVEEVSKPAGRPSRSTPTFRSPTTIWVSPTWKKGISPKPPRTSTRPWNWAIRSPRKSSMN